METRTVSKAKGLELQALLSAARAGKLKNNPAHYKLEGKGDVLLVDPVNSEPFVFVAPATVHVFPYKPGSGTDHLCQRTEADLWFQRLTSDEPTNPKKAASASPGM